MSPTFETKDFKKDEVAWQQFHLCIEKAEHQILGGKQFHILGPEPGNIVENLQYLQISTIAYGPSCVARNPKWILSQSRQSFVSTES